MSATAQAMEVEWIRQFGTSEFDQAFAVSLDASGIYVAGRTLGTLPGETSSGGSDAFVRKYDAFGTDVWTRQFGSSGEEMARALALDASGVYVAGHTGEALPGQDLSEPGDDAFLRKYDHEGTELWTRQFNSSNEDLPASYVQAMGLAVDDSGVYVAGWTDGALPGQNHSGVCCPPDVDAFVRKYNHAGREVWTRQFGSNLYHSAWRVAVDASGVYVTGTTNSWKIPDVFVWKFDLAGADLWTLVIGANDKGDWPGGIVSDGSAVYVVGSSATQPYSAPSGLQDAWVHKYDPDGVRLWNRTISTPEEDWANGVALDPSGIYLLGSSGGTLPNQTAPNGPFVRQYDPSGDEVWTEQYDLPVALLGIAVSSSVLGLAGLTSETLPGQTNYGGDDAVLIKLRGPDRPPVAVATADALGVHMGEIVRFDAWASTDDRGIVAYEWDFADGATARGVLVTHAYASRGFFEVVLTVRDAMGEEAQDRVVVEVVNRAPVADAGPDRTVAKYATVALDGGASSDDDEDALTYSWSQIGGPGLSLSNPDTATPMFHSPGTGVYWFQLTVSDGYGGTTSDSVEIRSVNGNPTIGSADPDGNVQLALTETRTFVVHTTDPDEDALTYVWSIDGVEVSRAGPSYVASFDSPGTRIVNVTVTDGELAAWREWTVVTEDSGPLGTAADPWSEYFGPVVFVVAALLVTAYVRFRERRRR
jgi:hypothetical protein